MKRILTFVAACTLAMLGVMAQNLKPVHGYVIDKKYGSPIVGAEVSVPGGGETTITDADGSFTLNVTPYLKKLEARYDGMQSMQMKVNFRDEMVFELKGEKKHPGFLNIMIVSPNIAFTKNCNSFGGTGGLMFGQLGNWGWYGKVIVGGHAHSCGPDLSVTTGAVKQLNKNKTYMYFGAGFGMLSEDDCQDRYCHHYYGPSLDCGFIFRTSKHFNLIAGINTNVGFDGGLGFEINLNLGFGFTF